MTDFKECESAMNGMREFTDAQERLLSIANDNPGAYIIAYKEYLIAFGLSDIGGEPFDFHKGAELLNRIIDKAMGITE